MTIKKITIEPDSHNRFPYRGCGYTASVEAIEGEAEVRFRFSLDTSEYRFNLSYPSPFWTYFLTKVQEEGEKALGEENG